MKKRTLSIILAASMSAMLLPSVACAASGSYTEQNATLTEFSDGSVTAAGAYSGYEIDGTAISITEAGTYVLSGACADGSVTVKKGVTGVTLVLDGLDLTSTTTSPITIKRRCSLQRAARIRLRTARTQTMKAPQSRSRPEARSHWAVLAR